MVGVTGIFGIARDITERRFQDRESAPEEKRDSSRFLTESTTGSLSTILNNGTILEANAKIIEMFGYKRVG